MSRRRAAILCSIAALTALAFYLRTLATATVFDNGFVNFTETDAWFHIRSIDHLVRNFPHSLGVDPYFAYGNTGLPPAGPFFDWLPAAFAWIVGAGHPSDHLIHVIAAWYPAVLGSLIVPVVFLLGRAVFGTLAGLLAAAVAATLPGHFLSVGSLGYTDHHVLESLLAAVVLLLIVRGSRLAGVALGAYLLTFVGGAFLVAVIAAWAAYSLFRRDRESFDVRPVYWGFGIATLLVLPFYRVMWMPYSLAALIGGALALAAIDVVSRSVSRTVLVSGFAILAAIAVVLALKFTPLGIELSRLNPSGHTGGVSELRPLIFSKGFFSLEWAWQQFAGAYVLAIVAVILLAELCIRRPDPARDLIFFFGLATFLLAAAQVRMTYYFAVAAALFSGFLASKAFDSKARARSAVAAAILIGLLFWPNISSALDQADIARGIPPDWREAMDWIRASTPEPFADPNFYNARYTNAPLPDYSVMAWWDYGYWITSIAHRVPVSNPTQDNASVAASFFLAQSEPEARSILDHWHSRYVIANTELPIRDDADSFKGLFMNFFEYDRDWKPDDFVLIALEPEGPGTFRRRLLYKPAYFRSMAVHLATFGGDAVEASGAALAFLRPSTRPYPDLVELRRFSSEAEALAAEPSCRAQGCVLVSDRPASPCVRLDALSGFRQVYNSPGHIVRVFQVI